MQLSVHVRMAKSLFALPDLEIFFPVHNLFFTRSASKSGSVGQRLLQLRRDAPRTQRAQSRRAERKVQRSQEEMADFKVVH